METTTNELINRGIKLITLDKELTEYLCKHFGKCNFTEDKRRTAIELSIQRGNETNKQIIKDAVNFLYY